MNCVPYPCADAAAFEPRDYVWLSPALLLSLFYVAPSICIRQQAGEERGVFGSIAAAFAVIAGICLAADYFIWTALIVAGAVSSVLFQHARSAPSGAAIRPQPDAIAGPSVRL